MWVLWLKLITMLSGELLDKSLEMDLLRTGSSHSHVIKMDVQLTLLSMNITWELVSRIGSRPRLITLSLPSSTKVIIRISSGKSSLGNSKLLSKIWLIMMKNVLRRRRSELY